jgi:murein DD-endopeptidase MepM/ murein hydrolase activator NlpD
MKPSRWILSSLLGTSMCLPLVGIATEELGGSASTEVLLASLPKRSDRVWVQVVRGISNEELAQSIGVDESQLASLNDTDEDHRYETGDWLALPIRKAERASRVASLDTRALRHSLPLQAPPPLVASNVPVNNGPANTVVRFGDTLLKIAQRYGMTIAELLRLNPGLETASLVVGSQVRVAQSSPSGGRMLLAIKPVGSGGLSWPELPRFGQERPDTFDPGTAAWVWPAQGVFTSGFGWRWGRMHKGIDIANNVGTPIVAAASGRVTYAGWDDGGYGYLVRISHEDGSTTVYGHNSRILVREGDLVSQGQAISEMGSTGRSTGPHLHFEIHPPGSGAANPLQFLPPRA